jgi:hypothetical protein
MLQAWVAGVGVLFLAHGAWVIVLKSETYPRLLVWTLQSLPFIAALVTAYLAPTKKILLAVSIGLVGAVLTVASNYLYEVSGLPVDFPGLQGATVIFVIALVSNTVLCTLGGLAGYYLARFVNSRSPTQ